MILLARTLALELAPTIRVNAVCPGYVLTPMQEAEYIAGDARSGERVDSDRPPRRARRRSRRSIAFLASDEARYFTGAVISIDGGETA